MAPSKVALHVAAAAQMACYAIAWCCIAIAILFPFTLFLARWSWNYDDPNNVWVKFDIEAWIHWYNLLPGYKLFTGWDVRVMTFLWLTAAFASTIALVPSLVLSKEARKASWHTPGMNFLSSTGRMVRRTASYPMWPHKFWLWYCNGLSVFDAFIWMGFLVFHLLCVAYVTEYYYSRTDAWASVGLAFSVPRSVYKLQCIGLAFAWTLMIDIALLFFPVSHVSCLHTLLGSGWQAVIRYHRWIGHFTMWTTTGHGLFYYFYWLCSTDLNFWHEFFDWNRQSSINFLAGSISFAFGLALWITSLNWVRRRYFTVFYVTHIVGFLGYVLFAHMHYYYTYIFIAPGLILYALDVAMRVFQAQHVAALSSISITPSGGLALLDIPLADDMAMKPGQEVFLQFPSFSRWAWHPFTVYKVNRSQEPGTRPSMTIAIKKYGRWTKALMKALQAGEGCPVRLVGPVGGLHRFNPEAPRVVMFVGGIGASPALATLHHMIANDTRVPTTVIFATRDVEEFTIIDEELVQEATRTDRPWLTMMLYDTSSPCKSCGNSKPSCGAHHDLEHQSSSSSEDRPWKGLEKVTSLPSRTVTTLEDLHGSAANTAGWSAFGWTRIKAAQPRVLNNWLLLLATCLAWTGGFMGAVQAQSGVIERWYQKWTLHDSWAVGLLYAVCIGVQALGLPAALVVFPAHVYKYWTADKSPQPVATTTSPYINILGHGKVGSSEAAMHLDVRQGRPDIAGLLKDAVAGARGEEIPVIIAGPTLMMNAAEEAAWNLNKKREPGQPFLHVLREAYEI